MIVTGTDRSAIVAFVKARHCHPSEQHLTQHCVYVCEREGAKSVVQLALSVNITGKNLCVQCVLAVDCVSTKNLETHALNAASICGFASVIQIPLRTC